MCEQSATAGRLSCNTSGVSCRGYVDTIISRGGEGANLATVEVLLRLHLAAALGRVDIC